MSSEDLEYKRQWLDYQTEGGGDLSKISFCLYQMKTGLQSLKKWNMYANMGNQSHDIYIRISTRYVLSITQKRIVSFLPVKGVSVTYSSL